MLVIFLCDCGHFLLFDSSEISLSVPESKLASWQRAQLDPPSPLSRSEELLKRKIMERLYGPGKADDPK